MEFETACIYRMRKILSDLSTNIENSLKNVQPSSLPISESTRAKKVSASAADLIEHLRHLNDLVDIRMSTKPAEKLERDNYLCDSIANLKCARDEVEALKLTLEEERSRHHLVVQAISAEIFTENVLLEEIKSWHATEIAERIKESEAEISRIEEETAATSSKVKEKIDSMKTGLRDTMTRNLSHERELRTERSKAERQYLDVVANYDRDVGSLYCTKDNLTQELNRLDDRLKDLRDQLAIQNVQYVNLKNERELAIIKAFTRDLENFEKNRAAKIIQRAWRAYYERCCMRKKKKSKKKKN